MFHASSFPPQLKHKEISPNNLAYLSNSTPMVIYHSLDLDLRKIFSFFFFLTFPFKVSKQHKEWFKIGSNSMVSHIIDSLGHLLLLKNKVRTRKPRKLENATFSPSSAVNQKLYPFPGGVTEISATTKSCKVQEYVTSGSFNSPVCLVQDPFCLESEGRLL